MSTVECDHFDVGGPTPTTPVPGGGGGRAVYHRIQEVRLQQSVSLRSAARKMSLSMQEVRDQEDPHCNLTVGQLLAWQQVLEVPLADLLVDNEAPLSMPVRERAQLLLVMKTAKSLDEHAADPMIQRLSTMLVKQLVELMPELRDVSAWHTVGQRRTQDELGRIVERTLPDTFFSDR